MLKPRQQPLDCAVTAQIAHRKYAVQYARLVHIRVRTASSSRRGSHFWFAPSYARIVRTRPAVTTLVNTENYQRTWFPVASFHRGCQGFAAASTATATLRKVASVMRLWDSSASRRRPTNKISSHTAHKFNKEKQNGHFHG